MLARAHQMLDLQADLLHSGNFERVADLYDIPLGVHVEGELLVYRSRLALLHGLQNLMSEYRANGVRALCWHLAAIELVRDRRFRLWINWDHVFDDRIESAANKVTYFCRLEGQGLKVEMVQYQAMAPHILAAQIATASRSG